MGETVKAPLPRAGASALLSVCVSVCVMRVNFASKGACELTQAVFVSIVLAILPGSGVPAILRQMAKAAAKSKSIAPTSKSGVACISMRPRYAASPI